MPQSNILTLLAQIRQRRIILGTRAYWRFVPRLREDAVLIPMRSIRKDVIALRVGHGSGLFLNAERGGVGSRVDNQSAIPPQKPHHKQ